MYGAYWMLRALYTMDVDHGRLALDMLTNCDRNSWCHMLEVGATTVMEAWTRPGKPNLSWPVGGRERASPTGDRGKRCPPGHSHRLCPRTVATDACRRAGLFAGSALILLGAPIRRRSHPWASAPASAVAWGFFGLVPLAPGFRRFRFKPQPGAANVSAALKLPTLAGFIAATIEQTAGRGMRVTITPPASTLATVCLPRFGIDDARVQVDGRSVEGAVVRDYVCVAGVGSAAAPRVLVRGVVAT